MQTDLKIQSHHFQNTSRLLKSMFLLSCVGILLSGCGIRTLPTYITQQTIPEALRVPSGQQAVLEVRGQGLLTYECQAIRRSPFQYSWLVQSSGIRLEGNPGQSVTYYPGSRARWVHSDGSSVSAREFVEDTSSTKNLPLLRATAETSTGPGMLDKISYIQRVRTVGGVVTGPECNAGNLGMRVSTPYESNFVFWRPAA